MIRPLLLALAAVAVLSAPAQAQTKIQPGAQMRSEVGGCTLNFIYDGLGKNAGKVYVGTAAHCVEKVGVEVEDRDGTVIGRTAAVGSSDDAATDWAFVEILAEHLSRVDSAVKGWPGYPTGVLTSDEPAPGDLVQASGYGMGFGATQPTQEQRKSILQSIDSEIFTLNGPNVNGDSGGPFVHVDTGKALGIVSQYGFFHASTDVGPTVEGILAKASKAGFPVALRPAGATGPVVPAASEPAPQSQQPQSQPAPQQPQSQPAPSQSQPAPSQSSAKPSGTSSNKPRKKCKRVKVRNKKTGRKTFKKVCKKAGKKRSRRA